MSDDLISTGFLMSIFKPFQQLPIWTATFVSIFLKEQLANHRLGSLICAFPYVTVADYAAFIDEHNGRPCPHAVAVPNLETVILNHGIFDAELRRGFLDSRERSLPEKFGRMNAYDR